MFRKEYSIKTKLSLSYILYIIMFFIFVAILSNIIIQRQFIEYSKDKQRDKINEMIEQIENQYDGRSFNQDTVQIIGEDAFDHGFIIGVYNNHEERVYDANYHYGHMCNMMINDLYQRMREYDRQYSGEIVTVNYDLMDDNTEIGQLTIRHLSPYFYDESDLSFLSTLNQLYLISSLIFIIIAFIIASIVARKIAKPIEVIRNELSQIEKGNYKKNQYNKTNTKEINSLANSINSLKVTLENQENLRRQLSADVAHELRTPLSTLQATLEAMLDGIVEVNDEAINNLHEEISRLTTIVSNLDKLHEYENHDLKLNKEYFDISILIKNITKIFQAKFEQKQIDLKTDLKKVIVYADKDKMYQVLINILSNALKYSNDNGQVSVSIIDEQKYCSIKIKDNGIGINESELPFIFERFYRADKSRARETGGHGIGLSIVKSIIDAHNGEISIESSLNKGTEVKLKIMKNEVSV